MEFIGRGNLLSPLSGPAFSETSHRLDTDPQRVLSRRFFSDSEQSDGEQLPVFWPLFELGFGPALLVVGLLFGPKSRRTLRPRFRLRNSHLALAFRGAIFIGAVPRASLPLTAQIPVDADIFRGFRVLLARSRDHLLPKTYPLPLARKSG